MRWILLVAAINFVATSVAFADNLSPFSQKKPIENAVVLSEEYQKLPVQNHLASHHVFSEMTSSTFDALSSAEQQRVSSLWGLSTNDYARYLALMENSPDGLYYRDQHLDPSWILGMNAKNETERRKYVALAILHERERMAKLLLFQQTFDRLQHELFPLDKPVQFSEKNSEVRTKVTCHQ